MTSLVSATDRALAVPELVLEIVAHLDQAELTRTALVCREWRASTENLLYRAVSVPSRLGADEDCSARSFSGLARTLAARPELAQRVKALHLWCPSPAHAPQGAARLLVLCRAVERLVCIAAFDSDPSRPTIQALSPLVAAYAPQLRHLYIENAHDWSALAPYLAALPNLTSLEFSNADFRRATDAGDVLAWPPPAFQLTRLHAFFHAASDPPPSLAEFEWLAASSRTSLRALTVSPCDADLAADLLTWGDALRYLHIVVSLPEADVELSETTVEHLSRATKLAELASLNKFVLSVFVSEVTSEAELERLVEDVQAAFDLVNEKRRRDVAVLEML